MHDLQSSEGILAYLKDTRFAASNVQPLSGGSSAFTFRVILEVPLETGEKTIVIKHFEGFVASRRDVKANAERAEHEYQALLAIKALELFDSSSTVQFPRPIQYDQETHTIFMHDFGSPIPLARVLQKGFSENRHSSSNSTESSKAEEIYRTASEIGQALGDFMGHFHNRSSLSANSKLLAYFANKPNLDHRISSVLHLFLFSSADRFKLREKWMDEFVAKQQETPIDSSLLVLGDCGIHNILVNPPSEGGSMRIYITDLEAARISYPEVDMGGLTASTMSLSLLFCPDIERAFIPALHQAYSRHRILDARRIGIAIGEHLAGFGPAYSWAKGQDETKAREVAVAGLELLKTSINSDEISIKTHSVTQNLFS
ncbi:hypothetical protein OPQ81_000790 [Rhizoctonia solani]|nr:hypothetical protein OPQ81_000790 [Rhizoctonia solani]